MPFIPRKKPSVSTAVRNLESALTELEAAEAHHRSRADYHDDIAKTAVLNRMNEQADADRANRVRTRLAELLA